MTDGAVLVYCKHDLVLELLKERRAIRCRCQRCNIAGDRVPFKRKAPTKRNERRAISNFYKAALAAEKERDG